MNFSQIVRYMQSPIPQAGIQEYQEWLDCTDALSFLINATVDQVPIYISAHHFFIHAILIPKDRLRGNYVDNILRWNMGVSAGWGYSYGYNQNTKRVEKEITPPLDRTDSTLLDGGEAIVFVRSIYDNGNTYLELNQQLTHILGIHKVESRSAYCRVDEAIGELINTVSFTNNYDGETICTIDKQALDFYMFLTDTVLVQLFDVTRWNSGSFSG